LGIFKLFLISIYFFTAVPPTIDGELNEKHTVIEGETITLDCIVNGIPQPNVYWRRNFKRFLPKSGRFTFDEFGLKITSAKTTDRALYECVAENVAGETSKVITVIVQSELSQSKCHSMDFKFDQRTRHIEFDHQK